jgi:hypothetical protein
LLYNLDQFYITENDKEEESDEENEESDSSEDQDSEEKDDDLKVSTGVWAYCPKSEWKALTRRVKPVSKKETEEGSEDKPVTKRGKNSIQ